MFPKIRSLRSEKLIEKIINKYPWILEDCIEVFVPDTWHDIIMEAISKFEKKYKEHNIFFCESTFGITQIKEKFGTLRLYINTKGEGTLNSIFFKEILDILNKVEIESGEICAVCGTKEFIFNKKRDGYIAPAKCPNCVEKLSSIEF